MSSVSIRRAKDVYGGETEEETLRQMAQAGGYRRVYKYKGRPDSDEYTDYKRIAQPGDAQERAMLSSPAIRAPILVYDDGRCLGTVPDSLVEEFSEAVRNADLDIVRRMLDGEPSLVARRAGQFKTPPLVAGVVAVRKDRERGRAVMEFLLEHGADVNAVDFQDDAAVHGAAEGGDTALVEFLLARGADVNARGCSPALHRAARNSHLDTMKVLLANGANVHSCNDEGETALHYAARKEGGMAVDSILLLLTHGAEVDAANKAGQTPLLIALKEIIGRDYDEAVVRTLLAHGADVNATDADGCAPLHYAVNYKPPAVVELLLSRGADPTAASRSGQTPIAKVVNYEREDEEAVRSLLRDQASQGRSEKQEARGHSRKLPSADAPASTQRGETYTRCPNCGTRYQVRDSQVGKTATCRRCTTRFKVTTIRL